MKVKTQVTYLHFNPYKLYLPEKQKMLFCFGQGKINDVQFYMIYDHLQTELDSYHGNMKFND